MAHAETHEVLNVDYDKLFDVITRYEDYPQFIDGVKSVQVERKGPGHARVKYHISMIKDVIYTLDLKENRQAGTIQWTLVESDFFKVNNGGWKIKSVGIDKTDALYAVDIDFKIFVPSMILNKLIKGSFPSMIKNFENRAKNGG